MYHVYSCSNCRFKRTLLQARLKRLNDMENQCPHLKVENWVCQECNNKVSSFGCIFDSLKGKVRTFMKVVYENDFLEDFQNANSGGGDYGGDDDEEGGTAIRQSNDDDNEVAAGLSSGGGGVSQPAELLYQQYQPSNVTELREYILFTICKKLKKQFKKQQSPLGPGHVNHLSNKLINYLQDNQRQKKRILQKFNNDVLLFDSIFESGNLLQAEIVNASEYQLYMQVDTNTRGHQQWFYFRVRNTKKNRKYVFRIMNFTKQGLTAHTQVQNNNNNGGSSGNQNGSNTGAQANGASQPGLAQGPSVGVSAPQTSHTLNNSKKNDHLQKIHFRSKLSGDDDWRVLDSDQIDFVKTGVQRKRKDILAAAADSDQEDMDEVELMEQQVTSQKFLKNKSPKKRKAQYYYAMQFEVSFMHNNDSVYFAYSLPYTLTDMTEKILVKEKSMQAAANQEEEAKQGENNSNETPREMPEETQGSTQGSGQQSQGNQTTSQAQATQGGTPIWQENGVQIEVPSKSLYYKREILSRSICGLPIYQITITRDRQIARRRPLVIITSRVHAAETPSSFVFEGIYNFLCSNNQEAKFLRKFYTFILVPTLNPDGVVCGNYRSSISGVDLNRQWIQPDEEFHPEIYAIKTLMKNFYEKERRQMWIYCDLHGHSKKKNSFFYGCNTAANGGFLSWTIVRLLPRIFAQKTHLFNYKDCRFKVEPYKFGTGRVVAWKQFMITHSFTMETSFYGYDFGEDDHRIFTEKEYSDVGIKLCQSIFELHFLWKSIRNELKLTNGWLKPRKLLEITGVPAAQILNEELQKKKKEDLKRKAIEQYEQFLKKFYNNGSTSKEGGGGGTNQMNATGGLNSQNFRRQSKMVSSATKNIDQGSIMPGLQRGKTMVEKNKFQGTSSIGNNNANASEQVKSRNRELTGPGGQNSETLKSQQKGQSKNHQTQNENFPQNKNGEQPSEQDHLYQLLLGLVKIQALIRGFLTRKKIARIPRIRIQKSPLRQPNRETMKRQGDALVTEEDGPPLHHLIQLPSMQKPGSKSSASKNIPVDEAIEGFNWRQYFQEQELDEAYHHVEVEKEDDPQDNFSQGSSSNPSQDNFEMQEIYEQIYQCSNAQEIALRKEEANTRFMMELNDQDYIDQQAMFQLLDDGFKGKRIQVVRQSMRGKSLKNTRGIKTSETAGKSGGPNSQFTSPDKAIGGRRPSFYEQKEPKRNDQIIIVQNSDDIMLHPLTAHQIIDPNKLLEKGQSSQARLQTGNPNKNQGNGQNQGFQNISHMHFKIFNQSQTSSFGLSGMNYGKKESIQQVIKDCFITKKIGNTQQNQQQHHQQHHQPLGTQQASFFGIGNGLIQSEAAYRVHSMNNHRQIVSGTLQQNPQTSIQSGKKPQNHHQQRKSSNNYIHKTPAQKIIEQREQIKQYFNQGGTAAQVQMLPISSIQIGPQDKYRSFIANGSKLLTGVEQPFYSQHSELYHTPPFGGNALLDVMNGQERQSMTYYGGNGMGSSKVHPQNIPTCAQSSDQAAAAASSLFMKYVKSKIVKKIKTDQIPQQVADKYIDIYKELIDKEAQRKQEEQEFLKRQRRVIAGHPGGIGLPLTYGVMGNMINTVNPSTVTISQNNQQQQNQNNTTGTSRNKTITRSEQKSRRQKPAATQQAHHTSRKEPPPPPLTMPQMGGLVPNPQKLDDLANIADNLHDLNFSSSQINKGNKASGADVVVRSSFDGETFLHMKQGLIKPGNMSNSVVAIGEKGMEVSPLKATGVYRSQYVNHLDNSANTLMNQQLLDRDIIDGQNLAPSYLAAASSGQSQNVYNPAPVSSTDANQVKFPMINNFSSTMDYKKKSRDATNEQKHLRSAAMGFPSSDNSSHQPTPGIESYELVMGGGSAQNQNFYNSLNSKIGGELANPFNSLYSVNHGGVPTQNTPQSSAPAMTGSNDGAQQQITVHQGYFTHGVQQHAELSQHFTVNSQPFSEQATAEFNNSYGHGRELGFGQASEKSVDSSIDEEMLDKIKNIYSEMRKHTQSTQYYVGGPQAIALGASTALYHSHNSNNYHNLNQQTNLIGAGFGAGGGGNTNGSQTKSNKGASGGAASIRQRRLMMRGGGVPANQVGGTGVGYNGGTGGNQIISNTTVGGGEVGAQPVPQTGYYNKFSSALTIQNKQQIVASSGGPNGNSGAI